MAELAITANQQFYYSNKDKIPIHEIIESLLASERMLRRTLPVLRELFPDIEFDGLDVYIDQLSSGSLLEKFVLKFFFKDEESYDKWIEACRERFGMDDPKRRDAAISALVAGLIALGTVSAYNVLSGSNSGTTITGDNNKVINVGGNMYGIPPEDFMSALDKGAGDKRKLAEDAVTIIRPAKADKKASLVIDEDNDLVFLPAYIKEAPSEYKQPEPKEKLKSYTKETIEIRKLNRDSYSSGWWVVLPNIDEGKRVKMKIDADIDLEDIATQRVFYGDITVEFHIKDKKQIPAMVHLTKIYR